jgi:hypothetical protein
LEAKVEVEVRKAYAWACYLSYGLQLVASCSRRAAKAAARGRRALTQLFFVSVGGLGLSDLAAAPLSPEDLRL